jgi:hypothetical protein
MRLRLSVPASHKTNIIISLYGKKIFRADESQPWLAWNFLKKTGVSYDEDFISKFSEGDLAFWWKL